MEEAKVEKKLKKSKNKNKVASLLLALALILTCGVAGTIAQYQKSFGGTSTANVAKFQVSASNLKDATASDQTIDLFKTVKDTAGSGALTDDDDVQNGIAPGTQGYFETELKNTSDVNVYYELDVTLSKNTGIYNDSTSGLSAELQAINNKYIPLQFAIAYTEPTQVSDLDTLFKDSSKVIDLSAQTPNGKDLTLSSEAKTELPMDTTSQKNVKKVYICWRWAFEDSTKSDARNLLDTAIGESIANNDKKFTKPEVKVSVTFTQKD